MNREEANHISDDNKMICDERLSEIIKIEKERILKEFETKNAVLCDSYVSWGAIHSAKWIYREDKDDLDWNLNKITREKGFICFKSTPNFIEIIKAAALVHFGVLKYNPVIS